MLLEGQRRRARQPLLDWCKSSDTKCWKTYQRRLSARNGNVRTSVCMICFQRNSDFVAKSEILKGANRAQQFNCDRHTQQKQCPNWDTISRKQNLQETTATPVTSLIQKPAGHPSRNSNVWMDRTLDPPGFILSLIGHFGATPIRLLPRTENRVTAPPSHVYCNLCWNLCASSYYAGVVPNVHHPCFIRPQKGSCPC